MLLVKNDFFVTVQNLDPEVNEYDINAPIDQGIASSGIKKAFILDFRHIASMRIIKSYDSHITEIVMDLEYLTTDEILILTTGQSFISIEITSSFFSSGTDSNDYGSSANVFVVQDYSNAESYSDESSGGIIFNKVSLHLYSLTLTRMLAENNFSFQTQDTAAGAGLKPKEFLTDVIQKIFLETYTKEIYNNSEGEDVAKSWFRFNDEEEVRNKITSSSPTTGYILHGKNNFEILNNYFKEYPVLLTPHNWILDDLPVDTPEVNGPTSQLVVTDFFVATACKRADFISNIVSNVGNQSQELAEYFEFNFAQIRPIFNSTKFESSTKTPMIQLIQSQAGIPTIVDATKINKTVSKFIANKREPEIKLIQNPTVKKIYTFMTESDIISQLAFRTKYEATHPKYEKYTFKKVAFHFFNVNEALYKSIKNPDITDASIEQVGPLYQIEYTFKRFRTTAGTLQSRFSNQQDEIQTYSCDVQVEYATTMKVPSGQLSTFLDIEAEVNDLKLKLLETIIGTSSAAYQVGTVVPYRGKLEIKGVPGDIAKTAGEMIDKGFKYAWGYSGPLYYDCSGFTMRAVCAATGLIPFGSATNKKSFPKHSKAQYNWCLRYAKPIEYGDVQAGDLIFLGEHRKPEELHHVGIAKSPTEVYHSTSAGSSDASSCSPAEPCKGAMTSKRMVDGPDGSKDKSYWDRQFIKAFRIEGHEAEEEPNSPGYGVGVWCNKIAKIESAGYGGYNAYNTSSGAKGAYQFTSVTKDDYARKIGLDPNSSSVWDWQNQDAMCEAREKDLMASLERAGKPQTLMNMYILWQQGLTGGLEIIDAITSGNVSAARASNMSDNMHFGSYTGPQSYLEDTEKFIRSKGLDPYSSAEE